MTLQQIANRLMALMDDLADSPDDDTDERIRDTVRVLAMQISARSED